VSYALVRCLSCEEPLDLDEAPQRNDDPDLCGVCNLREQDRRAWEQ
jgi:hypothetical protein